MFLVEQRTFHTKYAMKRVSKLHLESQKDIRMAETERKILEMNNHPFIINLHYAFQTEKFLYYVMDFAEGGELFTLLKRKGKFSEKVVQQYAAEIVLALGHLHSNDILYSDLKLENLLIDSDGHFIDRFRTISNELPELLSSRYQGIHGTRINPQQTNH